MNRFTWLGTSFIVVIFLSIAFGGYYFFYKNNDGGLFGVVGKEVEKKARVEGVKTQNNETPEIVQGRKSKEGGELAKTDKIVDELLVEEVDAPVLKDGVGETYVRARSSIVIDAESGTILHYQDGKKRTAIASLTKIMTAIVVVENIEDLEKEIVTIDPSVIPIEGTRVGCPSSTYCMSNRLQSGEKISAMSLFEAMLMNSANDAAVALGIHIAGSQKAFADIMNRKAEELGLRDTHFCNPSGLDEDDNPGGCYSTAYDLARITAYSLKHDIIWNTLKTKGKEVYSLDGTIAHRIINTDKLLDEMPNCLGGKTGFTYEAGISLMMAAHHPLNKNTKVVAVMIDNNYRWHDIKILFNWVFNAYSWSEIDKK